MLYLERKQLFAKVFKPVYLLLRLFFVQLFLIGVLIKKKILLILIKLIFFPGK